jgi:hypothetical protein
MNSFQRIIMMASIACVALIIILLSIWIGTILPSTLNNLDEAGVLIPADHVHPNDDDDDDGTCTDVPSPAASKPPAAQTVPAPQPSATSVCAAAPAAADDEDDIELLEDILDEYDDLKAILNGLQTKDVRNEAEIRVLTEKLRSLEERYALLASMYKNYDPWQVEKRVDTRITREFDKQTKYIDTVYNNNYGINNTNPSITTTTTNTNKNDKNNNKNQPPPSTVLQRDQAQEKQEEPLFRAPNASSIISPMATSPMATSMPTMNNNVPVPSAVDTSLVPGSRRIAPRAQILSPAPSPKARQEIMYGECAPQNKYNRRASVSNRDHHRQRHHHHNHNHNHNQHNHKHKHRKIEK